MTLLGLILALFLGSCVLFFPVMKSVLFAATLSVIMVPPLGAVEDRLGLDETAPHRRTLLALAATFLSLVVLAVVAALVVFVFVRNAGILEDFGIQVAAKIEEVSGDLLGAPFDLRSRAGESMDQLLGYVQGTFALAAGLLVDLLIFASALYIFLRHGRRIRDAIRSALPDSHHPLFQRFSRATHSSLYAIYVVHVTTAVITVILAVPFFYLIDFGEHVLFWSILCGSFQLVPILGPSLIMVAIAIYAFAQGDTTTGFLVLLLGYPVVGGLPDLFFRPLLMRSGMKIDAGILILGFFAGIVSMGMIGFVLGPLLLKLLVETFKLSGEELAGRTG